MESIKGVKDIKRMHFNKLPSVLCLDLLYAYTYDKQTRNNLHYLFTTTTNIIYQQSTHNIHK